MKIIINVEVEVKGTSISLILAEVKHLYIPSRQDESIEWPIRIQDFLHIFHGHCPRYNNCIYGFIGTHVCNKKKFVPNFIMVIDVFSFSQMAEAHLNVLIYQILYQFIKVINHRATRI